VLAEILGNEPNGRLHRELVESGLATTVAGFDFSFHDPGLLLAYAETGKEADLAALEAKLLAVVEGAAPSGFSDEEVERARRALLGRWEAAFRDSQRLAIGLSEWAARGDWRLLFLHRDRLEKVTTAEVGAAAGRYLVPNNRTLGRFLPTATAERAEVPPTPDVATLVAGYEGREALALGEAFDPTPAAIEGRLVRAELAAGLDLVLLPKKTRGETVDLQLELDLGSLAALRGSGVSGELAAAMLRRGTSERSRRQIEEDLDRTKSQLRITGGPTRVVVVLSTTRPYLDEGLALVAELVRGPSFPADELEILRRERLAELEEAGKDPGELSWTALERHLEPYAADDPRYTRSIDEQIAAVRALGRDEIVRFHADFYGAASGRLVLVGDFDAGEVERRMGELLAGFAPARPFERIASRAEARPAIFERLETPDKENAFLYAGLPLAMSEEHEDYPALVLGNFVLGGGFLNSRIATRLRQKEGLSYGAGSWLSADGLDPDGRFGGYAIYAPQNVDKVVAGFREEVARLLAEGFAEREFGEAKQGLLSRRQVSRGVDRELAALLARREFEGRTMEFERALDEAIAALTPDRVLAAMRRWIEPEKVSIVVAGDFAGKPPETAAP
jgi:zinc protease